jgi:hypothetical protein
MAGSTVAGIGMGVAASVDRAIAMVAGVGIALVWELSR